MHMFVYKYIYTHTYIFIYTHSLRDLREYEQFHKNTSRLGSLMPCGVVKNDDTDIDNK